MPHLHHPDSTLLDRILGIGSTPLPPDPDPRVVERLKEDRMPIQDHRNLFLATQPIGPVQAFWLAIFFIFLAFALT